jgi:putative lipoic acid-binding regulatory protein
MNEPPKDERKPLLTFPCDYPIKVMARVVPDLRTQLDAIMATHAGPLESHRISERPSAQQNFIGITYLIHAHSEQQIAALFEDLKQCPAVMLVL